MSHMTHEAAFALLKQYNKEPFLLRHGLTVEAVMGWFARENGEDEAYWRLVGLLHDIDYGSYPDEHCKKAPELLSAAGYDAAFIHAVCSHGYGICCDVEPTLLMEKILFAVDELTGLIWSAALMRPSKSAKDMELSSLKKKFKDQKFAAGVDRDIIRKGAEQRGWELEELLAKSLEAMKACEDEIEAACAAL